jgi:predicted TIM-barrel fold metal-dependent hydrolase
MIDGIPLIDAHLHCGPFSSAHPVVREWATSFKARVPLERLLDEAGSLVPERFHTYLKSEGVDTAILVPEHSPKVIGIQAVEDLSPLLDYDPKLFRFLANLNPQLHYPIPAELNRQVEMGAVGLKIHPVHGGFAPNDPALYPAYARCEELGLAVVFHTGTSIFPGAANRYADPSLIEPVAREFPGLTIVLAHGGRRMWFQEAAAQAMGRPNTWIEISGLPPTKITTYWRESDLPLLANKFIFGSDWPGVPGIRSNALGIAGLGLARETLERLFYRNAVFVYSMGDGWESMTRA